MTTWTSKTLGEICDEFGGRIQTGPFGAQLHQSDYSFEGIPVVMPKDLIGGEISTATVARITQEMADKLARYKLSCGEVVYGRRGDIGRHALIQKTEEGWICGTGCLSIKFNDNVLDPFFLHYYLSQNDVIKWIQNQAIGATMPNLNTGILRSMPVRYPNIEKQKLIASALTSYDSLIKNNVQRIGILEEMVQLLYTEWFVKLKFPGHEKIKMVESGTEYGKVHEGWNVKKLGDKLVVLKGKNITQSTVVEGAVPVVAGGLNPAYYHNKANAQNPVITVSASGANSGFVNLYQEDIWASDCSYVDNKSTPFVYFFYLFLKNKQSEITGLQRGSAQPHVYPKDLMQLPILDIPEKLMGEFETHAKTVFNALGILKKQNQNLSKTRDLLIPQLVTGKREVK